VVKLNANSKTAAVGFAICSPESLPEKMDENKGKMFRKSDQRKTQGYRIRLELKQRYFYAPK
jgi:hypothetical protein